MRHLISKKLQTAKSCIVKYMYTYMCVQPTEVHVGICITLPHLSPPQVFLPASHPSSARPPPISKYSHRKSLYHFHWIADGLLFSIMFMPFPSNPAFLFPAAKSQTWEPSGLSKPKIMQVLHFKRVTKLKKAVFSQVISLLAQSLRYRFNTFRIFHHWEWIFHRF